MTLKVNDVLQQMKTHCRNELTPVLAKYEEELAQLKQRLHNQEISSVQFTGLRTLCEMNIYVLLRAKIVF
jgi:hypothetical protein